MIGRIVRPADFQRVLAAPLRARSEHFAVHHVAATPGKARAAAQSTELSTALSTDEPVLTDAAVDLSGCWLGLVVPKRHAKRAVTRNLIKRQVRAIMDGCAPLLPPGLWVVRLRAPFDRQVFLSPASEVLRDCAHDELTALIDRAVRTPLPPRAPRPAGPRPSRARSR